MIDPRRNAIRLLLPSRQHVVVRLNRAIGSTRVAVLSFVLLGIVAADHMFDRHRLEGSSRIQKCEAYLQNTRERYTACYCRPDKLNKTPRGSKFRWDLDSAANRDHHKTLIGTPSIKPRMAVIS